MQSESKLLPASNAIKARRVNGAPPLTQDVGAPHDEAAELALLGCIIADNETAGPIIARIPEEGCFYSLDNRSLFSAIVRLHRMGRKIDPITVLDESRDVRGLPFIAGLPDECAPFNWPEYAEIVIGRWAARRTVQTVREIEHAACEVSPKRISAVLRSGIHALQQRQYEIAGIAAPDDVLTVRSPSEILAMEFDDSDNLLGDRLLADGQSVVIAGAGGLGKSRLLLQLAACQITGQPFIALETHGAPRRWLVFQTENSNRRLKADLQAIRDWLRPSQWEVFNAHFRVHTLETESDALINLGEPANRCRIAAEIDRAKPDVIGWDSAYDLLSGDLNKDVEMRLALTELSRVSKAGNPKRAVVLLHHALTGRSGASKAVGFERSSFARNSKVMHSWARGQINVSPGAKDDNSTMVLSCGKCSNGREFQPFAAILKDLIYVHDPDFDLLGWQSEVEGKNSPAMTIQRVAELCQPATKMTDLAKAIMEDCGCVRGTAYKWIKRSTGKNDQVREGRTLLPQMMSSLLSRLCLGRILSYETETCLMSHHPIGGETRQKSLAEITDVCSGIAGG